MLTIIAFLITLLGSVNWLTIGLLQYDFIAGIFGYQASVFSRIIYIIFGVACAFLVFKLFKGKGNLAVFSRRNKKDLAKNIAKIGHSKEEKQEIDARYSSANIEGGKESLSHYRYDQIDDPLSSPREQADYDITRERNYHHSPPRSLFDEHFDDRGER